MKKSVNIVLKTISYIFDMMFLLLVLIVFSVSCMIIFKTITKPYEVPDIFSYKPFILLDENMDDSLKYGDLVITKIVNTGDLKIGDLIAYRNNENFVTMHRIEDIIEQDNEKTFTMKIVQNEVSTAKNVKEDNVEGIFINRYSNVGSWLMFIQDPFGLLFIVSIILIIGVIAYYVAEKLDKREGLKSI